MQIVVWIIIILVIIFLIWLLRRWIRRLIFILILLVLAFFIYGIFNPSGASRLWYNLRTFPQRVTSWISSGTQFLDYDSYKVDVSSIGDKLGLDNIDDLDLDKESENKEFDDETDMKMDLDNQKKTEELQDDSVEKKTIKAFPKAIDFVEVPKLKEKNNNEDLGVLTGYSKSDILGVINKYIERNLDDDTDILVTVEYDEISGPQKIILETQQIKQHSASNSVNYSNIEPDSTKNVNVQSVQKNASNKLTSKEKKEAEEIYSILF